MNRNLARILLTTAGLIWGLGFIGNKFILDSGWTDSQLLFVRFLTATIVIFVLFFKRIIKADKSLIKSGLFLGVFLYLGFFFQTWGLDNTTASNNALITSGYIIMMPFIVYLFERKRVGYQVIIAGLITMGGISLITVDFQELTMALGDVLTFIGALFYAFHIYFLGKQSKKVDLVVLMAYQLLMFSVFATIMMIVRGGMPACLFRTSENIGLLSLAIGLGFFGSFVAFMLQSIGQKHTNESEAAILISTESVFGPIFAILFYNDPFNLFLLFGIILVFLGIVLSEINIDDLTIRRIKNDN